jgi:uncharacterized membrane protein
LIREAIPISIIITEITDVISIEVILIRITDVWAIVRVDEGGATDPVEIIVMSSIP